MFLKLFVGYFAGLNLLFPSPERATNCLHNKTWLFSTLAVDRGSLDEVCKDPFIYFIDVCICTCINVCVYIYEALPR